MDYELNKGIGESAEFKGLKAQYLFIFAGGCWLCSCCLSFSIWPVSANGSASLSV